MKRIILFIWIICHGMHAFPQYYSGNDDGYSSCFFLTSVNNPDLFCNGGNGDGFSSISTSIRPISSQILYCSGGPGDGYDRKSVISHLFVQSSYCYGGGFDDGTFDLFYGPATLNPQVFYVTGGNDDGSDDLCTGIITICDAAIYASGGLGDGFHRLTYIGPIYYSTAWKGGNDDGFGRSHLPLFSFSPTFYCLGGPDDGSHRLHLAPTYFGPGIWLGAVSTSWENPANWSADIVPGENINVLIPSGRSNYPFIWSGGLSVNGIGGYFQCKSLTIREGGSLINRSDLFIYGDMTVEGLYQGDDQFHNHVIVYPGGNLKIVPPGQMIVGEE
jgi:hypothetical protein